jgi:alpha-mannosidase
MLRMFEAGGGTAALAVSAAVPIRSAYVADLAERRQDACPIESNRVELTVAPFRIATLELELQGR